MTPEAEEALERGRELYGEIFESPFSDDVLTLLGHNSSLDNILFALFFDSANEGFIVDITDVLSEQVAQYVDDYNDGSPLYGVTALKLRTLMCAALTIGMWHQRMTSNLDTIWSNGVDKNPE